LFFSVAVEYLAHAGTLGQMFAAILDDECTISSIQNGFIHWAAIVTTAAFVVYALVACFAVGPIILPAISVMIWKLGSFNDIGNGLHFAPPTSAVAIYVFMFCHRLTLINRI
jgi:hypothetical protein